MTPPTAAIPAAFQWFARATFALVLVQSLRHAPRDYLINREDNNILFASIVVLWPIWQLRTDIPVTQGLEFHLLWLPTVTLMFGWAFAFLVICIADILITFQGIGFLNFALSQNLCPFLLSNDRQSPER